MTYVVTKERKKQKHKYIKHTTWVIYAKIQISNYKYKNKKKMH